MNREWFKNDRELCDHPKRVACGQNGKYYNLVAYCHECECWYQLDLGKIQEKLEEIYGKEVA